MSKQQLLCTSASQLTVETMIEGQNQTVPSDSSMSYDVHKVTPIHGTMCKIFKVFLTLHKYQEKVKVKTTGLVHNFIIPANC